MLKVGIVGTGSFARQHATAWRSVEGVELVGAYGADSQRLASYADRQSLQPFADLADLIDRADLIDIVSANRDHFAHAVQAVRAGRAIVVEKPLCTTLNNAESLQALVEEAGVLGAVVSQHRFHPANRAVKRRLQRDGGIHFVNAVCVLPRPASYYADHGGWRNSATAAGGGVLIHQAIHYIDLFIWWHGYPASWDGHWLFEDPQDDAVERRFWGELQNEGGVTIQFLFST